MGRNSKPAEKPVEDLKDEELQDEVEDTDVEEENERISDEVDAVGEEGPARPRASRGSSSRLQPAKEEEFVEEEVEADYLRQYQYKKVDNIPTIGTVETDPDKGSKADKMKQSLLAQPRVRILVPRAPGEHHSVLMSVNLNGYRLDFPKNSYVDMPEQIAQIIMESQKHTDNALQAFKIDGDQKKKDALL